MLNYQRVVWVCEIQWIETTSCHRPEKKRPERKQSLNEKMVAEMPQVVYV